MANVTPEPTDAQRFVQELDSLKFGILALAELAGTPGNFPGQNAKNVSIGLQTRIDVLIEKFNVLNAKLTSAAVAKKLSGAVGQGQLQTMTIQEMLDAAKSANLAGGLSPLYQAAQQLNKVKL